MNWMMILGFIGMIALAALAFYTVRQNPEAFSRENMGKSIYVLGILALALIVFIGLLILLVKG